MNQHIIYTKSPLQNTLLGWRFTSRVFTTKSIPFMCNHSKSPQCFVFEVTCSLSVSTHLSSHFSSVQFMKEEGVAPPMQFLMRLCGGVACVFFSVRYVYVCANC